MKLRALIGVTVSSLALCSVAHASLVTTESTTDKSGIQVPFLTKPAQKPATPQLDINPNPVPEPESWTLAVLALGAMALVQRRKSGSK